jgi:hypothetical protein
MRHKTLKIRLVGNRRPSWVVKDPFRQCLLVLFAHFHALRYEFAPTLNFSTSRPPGIIKGVLCEYRVSRTYVGLLFGLIFFIKPLTLAGWRSQASFQALAVRFLARGFCKPAAIVRNKIKYNDRNQSPSDKTAQNG